jgi:RNA polymerase sigma-70 factor (ECF subfamily)
MHAFDIKILDDKDLIALISEGNKIAFDAVYERYWESMYIYTIKVVKNREQTEDILQEVFISLWNRRKEMVRIECLSAYLFVSLRFQSLSYFKKIAKQGKLMEILAQGLIENHYQSEDIYFAKELSVILNQEIENLPSKMKEVFILSRNENLSYKEISDILKISDKTVKKQVSNALKVIKGKLSKAYYISHLLIILFSQF